MASTIAPYLMRPPLMRSVYFISAITVGALVSGATFAQTPANPSPANPSPPAATSAPATTPAPSTGNPNLVVASVKQEGGWRASKTIGSDVYNDQNQKIGSIDDLILSSDNKVQFAIISVGGFLGMGSKLVAVPYDKIQFDQAKGARKAVMADGSKEALNAQPSFTYGE